MEVSAPRRPDAAVPDRRRGDAFVKGDSSGASRDEGSRSGGDQSREKAGVGKAAGSARASARQAGAAPGKATPGKGRPTPSRDRARERANPFQRLVHFIREVVAELRKVIWPTKNEMSTYSVVVVVFLVF